MQIVIDINESDYKLICQHYSTLNIYATPEAIELFAETRIYNAIFKGTPLPDDAIIFDAKESDYVFVEKAKYNDLVEAASKVLTDRIKKSLYEGVIAESEAESEDILDKIRDEIFENRNWHMSHGQEDIAMIIDLEALAVIDKYKAESEVKEC